MKVCSACQKGLSREHFSNKQWQTKQKQRTCKECIEEAQGSLMKRATSTNTEAPSCWICLEDWPDEAGEPQRRDYACRGSSGFAHLSYLVQYATQKSREKEWPGSTGRSYHERILRSMAKLFELSPKLSKQVCNGLGERVGSFCRNGLSRSPSPTCCNTPSKIGDYWRTVDKILDVINQLDNRSYCDEVFFAEARSKAYSTLGSILGGDKSEES